MRNSSVLTALFPQVRQGVLAATLGQPDKWWYLSELADRLGRNPSSLQRELSSLVASGIMVHRREGTRAYFKAETKSPVFRDLQQLFKKTAGLAPRQAWSRRPVSSARQGGGSVGKGGQRNGLFPRGVSGESQITRPLPRRRFTRTETVCERRPE